MLAGLQTNILSTDAVEPGHRLTYWREAICGIFVELDCEAPDIPDGFCGRIVNRPIAALQFSDVVASPQHVTRSRERVARSRDDFFLISLQTLGEGRVVQDGRTARLGVGDFTLYDSTRPYELIFEKPFSQFVARIPRTAVTNRLVTPEWLTARRIDGRQGVGRIALSYLAELERQMPALDQHSGGRLSDTFLDLITLALSEPVQDRPDMSNVRLAQLYRIQHYIDDHLSDPELSPQAIAAAHRISPRYLNMLFEAGACSVSRWIWQRRIEKCERDLVDPRHSCRTIGELAYSWGFNDLTHFSRVFKTRYGMSPKDYRQAARQKV